MTTKSLKFNHYFHILVSIFFHVSKKNAGMENKEQSTISVSAGYLQVARRKW